MIFTDVHYDVIEVKSEGDQGVVIGHASTYRRDADGDIMIPSCFADTIQKQRGQVPLCRDHDLHNWVGQTTMLAEDHKGLLMEARLFMDTAGGRDTWGLLKNLKAIDGKPGLSIGFTIEHPQTDVTYDSATNTRSIHRLRLWEISVTPFPANHGSRVEGMKAEHKRELERFARDVLKCSVQDAKRFAALFATGIPFADANGQPLAPVRDVRDDQTLDYDSILRDAVRSTREILNAS